MQKASSEVTGIQSEVNILRCRIQEMEAKLALQERAQKELKEEHAFREAVIHRAAEGVCICHAIETYPYVEFSIWNRRMIKITGYTMEEINRRGWYQTVYPDPEVRQKAIERMNRMRLGEDLVRERWEITRADGQKRTLKISTSVLTSEKGVAHVLAMMDDVTEEELLQREKLLARVDSLTGVKNRLGFTEEAERYFKLAHRLKAPISMVYLDLDNFKRVNDTGGHAEGDRLLGAVGKTLSLMVRNSDLAARIGGDEFAIVVVGPKLSGMKIFISRLQERLHDVTRDEGWPVGVSIGVAVFLEQPPHANEALQRADALMYKAKNGGKDSIVYDVFSKDRVLTTP